MQHWGVHDTQSSGQFEANLILLFQIFFSSAVRKVNIFIIMLYSFSQDYLDWFCKNRALDQHNFLVYHIITLCYNCRSSLENLWNFCHIYIFTYSKKVKLLPIFWGEQYKNNSNSSWYLKLIIILSNSFVLTNVPTLFLHLARQPMQLEFWDCSLQSLLNWQIYKEKIYLKIMRALE